MKRNKQFDDLVARIPQETKERVWKQMSCKWFRGGDCGKASPGTPCNVVGCAAWVEYHAEEFKESLADLLMGKPVVFDDEGNIVKLPDNPPAYRINYTKYKDFTFEELKKAFQSLYDNPKKL